MEYIPEPPTFDDGIDETFASPSMDSFGPGVTESAPFAHSSETSSSRGSKRKTPMVDIMDTQFSSLTTKLDDISHALRQGNDNIDRLSFIAVEHNAIFRKHVQNWQCDKAMTI